MTLEHIQDKVALAAQSLLDPLEDAMTAAESAATDDELHASLVRAIDLAMKLAIRLEGLHRRI